MTTTETFLQLCDRILSEDADDIDARIYRQMLSDAQAMAEEIGFLDWMAAYAALTIPA